MDLPGYLASDAYLWPDIDPEFKAQLDQLRMQQMAADTNLVLRAREDPNLFIECIGRIEGGRWAGPQAGAHRMLQDHLTRSGGRGGARPARGRPSPP